MIIKVVLVYLVVILFKHCDAVFLLFSQIISNFAIRNHNYNTKK